MAVAKLHFVYNVELTAAALVQDFIHRLVDPDTYPCKLCDITYGRFIKKPRWQMFLWSLPVATAFYTKDALAEKFPSMKGVALPVALAEHDDGTLTVFLSRDDFNGFNSLPQLENALQRRLMDAEPAAVAKAAPRRKVSTPKRRKQARRT